MKRTSSSATSSSTSARHQPDITGSTDACDPEKPGQKRKKPKLLSRTLTREQRSGGAAQPQDERPSSPMRVSAKEGAANSTGNSRRRLASPSHTSTPTLASRNQGMQQQAGRHGAEALPAPARVPQAGPDNGSEQTPASQSDRSLSPRENWIARHDESSSHSFTFDECTVESINELAIHLESSSAKPANPGKTEEQKRLAAIAKEMQAMLQDEIAAVLTALKPNSGSRPTTAREQDSPLTAFSKFTHEFNKTKQAALDGKPGATASALAIAGNVLGQFPNGDCRKTEAPVSNAEKSGSGKKTVQDHLDRIDDACRTWAAAIGLDPAWPSSRELSGRDKKRQSAGAAPEKRNRAASSTASPGEHRASSGKAHSGRKDPGLSSASSRDTRSRSASNPSALGAKHAPPGFARQKRPVSMQLPGTSGTTSGRPKTQGPHARPDSPRPAIDKQRSVVPPLSSASSTGSAMKLASASSSPALLPRQATGTEPADTSDTRRAMGMADAQQGMNPASASNAAITAAEKSLLEGVEALEHAVDQWLG